MIFSYHSPGGLWDEDDDCCEPPCTSYNTCGEGEGHCRGDHECDMVSIK